MPSGRPRKTRWDVHCTADKECEVMWGANASSAVSSRNCNARHGAWHGVPPKTTFSPQVVVGLESYTPKKDKEAPPCCRNLKQPRKSQRVRGREMIKEAEIEQHQVRVHYGHL